MKAAPNARISLGLIGIGFVIAITNSLVNSVALSNKLYLLATVQLAVALVFAVRANKPDRAVWPVLLLIVLCSSVAQIFDGTFTDQPSLQAIPESLFLAVQLLLAGGLLFIMSSRLGSDPLSVLADGLIVALGAWFFIWTVLLQPTIGTQNTTTLISVIQGSRLGISAVVLFTLATLLFGDSMRSASVWFVAGAITFTLLGDFLYAANDANRINLSSTFSSTAYIFGLFLASAAFVHPTISTLTERGPVIAQRPLMGRLIVTTAALILPVVVLALTNPIDATDRAVQTISIFVLTAAVTSRVIHSVRANAATQHQLIDSAQTDALTGLPNRALMLTLVNNSLLTAFAESRKPTVLFIDVDRFKNINDSLGHQAGDSVLIAVAQRLRNALPHRCVVGRISGDEFVVLDPDTQDSSDAMQLADRVLESFHEPLSLRQGDVFVSASIGVSTYHPSITATADQPSAA